MHLDHPSGSRDLYAFSKQLLRHKSGQKICVLQICAVCYLYLLNAMVSHVPWPHRLQISVAQCRYRCLRASIWVGDCVDIGANEGPGCAIQPVVPFMYDLLRTTSIEIIETRVLFHNIWVMNNIEDAVQRCTGQKYSRNHSTQEKDEREMKTEWFSK